MRMLDAAGIRYEVLEYEVDESDLSGRHIAQELHFPPERMFKTLVARGDKTGPLVFCIPVCAELDLRRAAAQTGNKKNRAGAGQGAAGADRLHPGRLLAGRHEKEVPHMDGRERPAI